MTDWLPTPKMARVLWGGLLTVLLVFGADLIGIDLREPVKVAAPWVVAAVWGWAKAEDVDE